MIFDHHSFDSTVYTHEMISQFGWIPYR
uniref:Uncharacterized protein n=1 Tax=Arundo donax TaxID=35708 RepID=A0A0A9A2D2_ARUDO